METTARMKVITGGRRSGRTTKLIEMAAEGGGYIVCHTREEARRIFQKAKEMGLNILFPITYYEFTNRSFYSPRIRGFYIDNVEMLLHYMANPVRIKGVSILTEEED